MGKTIRAVFSGGGIRPLERIDLSEGEKISVSIVETEQSGQTATSTFKFDWAGGLKKAFPDVSSVDLQHQSLQWREYLWLASPAHPIMRKRQAIRA